MSEPRLLRSQFSGWLLLAFVALFVLQSCRATRSARSTKASSEALADSAATRLKANFFTYQWFSARAKMSLSSEDNNIEFTANIRAKKDSAIWVSISPALGIEVARVLITADSVRVIDRLNKKYMSYGYGVFGRFTTMPVDLTALENMLAGVPLLFNDERMTATRQDTTVVLTSRDGALVNALYLNPDYTLRRTHLVDSAMGKSLLMRFATYTREQAQPFALDRELELDDEKKTTVVINFSRIKVNEPQKMPFNVKDKYE